MPFADRPITVAGLRDVQAALKQVDGQSQKQLRVVLNDAAQVVVSGTRGAMPSRSGRARGSVRALSSQREARVAGGGGRASYYGWLDFGGSVGRRRSVKRRFIRDGRYMYATFNRRRAWILDRLGKGLEALIRSTGLGG